MIDPVAMPTHPGEPDLIGTVVNNYSITALVSRGGMGTVYRAEHKLIGRYAAIKVLHSEFSSDKAMVNRFFNEAKATTLIKHPGIVEVFDFGYLPSGIGYIAMEYLEGMSLARRVRGGGRYEPSAAAMLVRNVCGALAAAHAKGIVHRDLKPDNLFLIADSESQIGERVKILDFGIAKLTDIGLEGNGTKTGAVMGTPTYMSPEQCKGTGEVDARADLYSLGCILYQLVCGRPPFSNLGVGELIGAHLHITPERPSKHEPNVSVEMDRLIMSLLSKHPENRPASAIELAQKLETIVRARGYHVTPATPIPVLQTLAPLGDDHPGLDDNLTPSIEVTPQTSARTIESQDKPLTTLSGATASKVTTPSVMPPRRKRTAAVALGGAAVAIAIVVALVAHGGGQTHATASAPTGSASTAAIVPAAAPVATPTPAPAAPPATPVAPAPPATLTATQPTTDTTPAPQPTRPPTIPASTATPKDPHTIAAHTPAPAAIHTTHAPKHPAAKPATTPATGSAAPAANTDVHGPVVDDL